MGRQNFKSQTTLALVSNSYATKGAILLMPSYAEYKRIVSELEQKNSDLQGKLNSQTQELREKLDSQIQEHNKTKAQAKRERVLRDVYRNLDLKYCNSDLLREDHTRIVENIVAHIKKKEGDQSIKNIANETSSILNIVYDAAKCAVRNSDAARNSDNKNENQKPVSPTPAQPVNK